MSNYEYLRSLSLKELAKEIVNLPLCVACDRISGEWGCNGGDCSKAAVEWLKSERMVQNGG